jgi:hypothetical protein
MSHISAILTLTICSLVLAPSCSRQRKAASESAAHLTFVSPDAAAAAVVAAAASGDRTALLAIFGPNSKQVLFTTNDSVDKSRMQEFVKAYDQMHRWSRIKAGGQVLLLGADNYPFPIPLGQDSAGHWYFDTASGADEILARRIGRDELSAMNATAAIAAAEWQYHDQTHDGDGVKQYTQKFVSDPGKQDGLYWPVDGNQPPSPLGDLNDFTKVLSSTTDRNKPPVFNGYAYRILTKGKGAAAGFAVLAWPVEYRNTGIMSFLTDEKGALYQADLGVKTPEKAAGMADVDLGDGWKSAPPATGTASRAQ